MNKLACLVLYGAMIVSAAARPIDDLASPDQATRDAAAKILRGTYVSPPQAKWDAVLAKIRLGMTRQDLIELFRPYGIPEMLSGPASGGTTTERWRLDDAWSMDVSFNQRTGNHPLIPTDDGTNTVLYYLLRDSMRALESNPPRNFSGTWTSYYVNGQKSREINYRDGLYFGTLTSYHSNGRIDVFRHYDETGCNGEEIDYFLSGRVSFHGQYTHNRETGTWTWYKEDGSVQNTEDFTAHPLPH